MYNVPHGKKIRIYFLGSGEISIPVLAALAAAPEVDLVGCGTQPDRPSGRKKTLSPTPIAQHCLDLGLRPDKVESVNRESFVARLEQYDLDAVVVFSFGQILKQQILNLPRYGCVNIHASLLPEFRGASPISAAILNGNATTGISYIKMDTGLDTGAVYKQFQYSISGKMYADELSKGLAQLAADTVCSTLDDIVHSKLNPVPQNPAESSYAAKTKKSDGLISWSNDASFIEKQVRAYAPWPGAWFLLNTPPRNRRITVTAASVASSPQDSATPGTIVELNKHTWKIACARDALNIENLIPEGKKKMAIADFLRGNPLELGTVV